MPRFIPALEAALKLQIPLDRLYLLARSGRIIGVQKASDRFRRKHKPESGYAPHYMFDERKLAIMSVPIGRPLSLREDKERTMVRSTKLEELRWKIAAVKCSERLKLTNGSALTIGPWARRTLNEGADKLGVPSDAALVEQTARELGLVDDSSAE